MATRTQYNIKDVLRITGDLAVRGITRKEVLRIMGQVQEDICREGLALMFNGTLTMVAAKATYDINGNIYKVIEFIKPATWQYEIEIIHNATTWKEKLSNTYTTQQPLFGFIVDRFLTLYPTPTVSGEVISVIGYGLPENELAESADPEINKAWDAALVYGTVARIDPKLTDAQGEGYESKYMSSIAHVRAKEAKQSVAGLNLVDSSSRDLLF